MLLHVFRGSLLDFFTLSQRGTTKRTQSSQEASVFFSFPCVPCVLWLEKVAKHLTTEYTENTLGLDPLYVANEGKLVAIVAADQADAILARMKNNPLGVDACIIGEVKASRKE